MKNQLVDLQNELQGIKSHVEGLIQKATTKEELEAIRVEYLGRKGKITALMRGLKDVPADQRPAVGALANEIQDHLAAILEERLDLFSSAEIAEKLKAETMDVTMPGIYRPIGGQHPLNKVIADICTIFAGMGFEVIDDDFCPEIETEYYNFEALNFPEHHPARDMQDTYYTDVASNVLLRSQTSNAQIRYMENHPLPVRVVAPGRVYRNEEVNSRKFVLFHQLEGLLVDDHVRFSDLKGVLHEFIKQFFGGERPTRFRTS